MMILTAGSHAYNILKHVIRPRHITYVRGVMRIDMQSMLALLCDSCHEIFSKAV